MHAPGKSRFELADRAAGILAPAVALILACMLLCRANAESPVELKVKAGCVYHFLRLTEWPPHSFVEAKSPLVVGLMGESALFPILDDALKGRLIGGRSIELRRFSSLSAVTNCHLLLLSETASEQSPTLRDQPILTVSEADDFARRGGMINFVKRDGEVHFEVNTAAVQRGKLKLSSQLLKVAVLVKGEDAGR